MNQDIKSSYKCIKQNKGVETKGYALYHGVIAQNLMTEHAGISCMVIKYNHLTEI